MPTPRRILAFEPYDGLSHRAIRTSIDRRSRHRWRWFTRPARHWKWRARLAALELVESARASGAFDPAPDLLLCTSCQSVADVRAGLPPQGRECPIVLLMHENQAAYPAGEAGADPRDIHFALTDLSSMLAADAIVWTSRFNLESCVEGLATILDRAPDAALGPWEQRVRERSTIWWPPVEAPPREVVAVPFRRDRPRLDPSAPVRIAWPHRWEHDKGPEELCAVADRLAASLDVRWVLLGEQFRSAPPAMERFLRTHGDRIEHAGFEPDRAAYWQRLASCDWVLSTARHEFYGIAVIEAMMAGCLPWLPDRLSYPELLPPEARGLSPTAPPEPARRDAIGAALADHLAGAAAGPAVERLDAMLDVT